MRDIIVPYILQYDVGNALDRVSVVDKLTTPFIAKKLFCGGKERILGRPFRLILPKHRFGYWFLTPTSVGPFWHLYDFSWLIVRSGAGWGPERVAEYHVSACGCGAVDSSVTFKKMSPAFRRKDYRQSLHICPDCVRIMMALLRSERYQEDFPYRGVKKAKRILSDAEYSVEKLKERGEIPWYDL